MVVVIGVIIHLDLPNEIFLLKVLVVEDVGGRCGSGRVGAFVRCGARECGGRRDVVVVAAREHGASNRGEA